MFVGKKMPVFKSFERKLPTPLKHQIFIYMSNTFLKCLHIHTCRSYCNIMLHIRWKLFRSDGPWGTATNIVGLKWEGEPLSAWPNHWPMTIAAIFLRWTLDPVLSLCFATTKTVQNRTWVIRILLKQGFLWFLSGNLCRMLRWHECFVTTVHRILHWNYNTFKQVGFWLKCRVGWFDEGKYVLGEMG